MVVQGPEGNLGFARGICQTGVENPTEATFESCVFVTLASKQVTDAYREHTSGIVLA